MFKHLKNVDRWILGTMFSLFLVALFVNAPHVGFFALASIMWAIYDTLIFHFNDSIFGRSKFLKKHPKLYEYFKSDWRRYKKSYHGIPDFFARPFIDVRHLVKTIAVVSFALATPFWISALVMWGFYFNIFWEIIYFRPEKKKKTTRKAK